MNALNLYAGLGGNRKLWPKEVKVTAVEYNEEIAEIYKEYFPEDEVIVGDAHEYLLNNYKRFDFIWSSPPCPTHSKIRAMGVRGEYLQPQFIDMNLWQEIVLLRNFHNGRNVVENVELYYDPFIEPSVKMQRHFFWSNFPIRTMEFKKTDVIIKNVTASDEVFGFSLRGIKIKHRKDQLLRNLVNPELGLYILNQAMNREIKTDQLKLAI